MKSIWHWPLLVFYLKNGQKAVLVLVFGSFMPFYCRWVRVLCKARPLLVVCVLSMTAYSGFARADNYKITIDAPKDVTALLETYLDIVRYKTREDIRDEYLDFLVDQVPEQVASLLATQGYFDPKTEVFEGGKPLDLTNTTMLSDKPDLRVKVTLGERTVVQSAVLNVEGMIAEQDPKRVKALEFDWSLQEDEPFTQDEWSLSKTLLLRKIQADAYAAAKFSTTQASIEPEKKAAHLTATLNSGPYFTLGEPEVKGLNRYRTSVVTNANVIQVGEAYNRTKLLDYQKRLQDLPYFSSVLVDVGSDPNDAQLAPIRVQVVELPTQNFKGLVGYGTDLGVRANVQYNHFNVFKRGWVFDSKYDWQQKYREGRVSLATPQNKKHYQWSVVGKITQDRVEDYESDNLIFGVHRTRKLEHSSISYDLDYYHNKWGNTGNFERRNALFAGVTWAKNKVDNPSSPRKGYAIEASFGGAARGVASTASFVRAYGRFRYFIPFKKEDSLVLRVEGGAVFTKNSPLDIPDPLLFFAGGSSSVRGYPYQSIGDTETIDEDNVLPTKYLMTASAEYTHWLNKSWGAAVFYDVGTATNALNNVTIHHAVGAGVRWRSPVGPIHFDLAYGYPRKKLAPHISIGVLF